MNGILGHRYKSTTPRAFNIIDAANQSLSIIQQDKCKRYAVILKEKLKMFDETNKIKDGGWKINSGPAPDAIKGMKQLLTWVIEQETKIPSEDKPVLINSMNRFIEVAINNSTDGKGNFDPVEVSKNLRDIIDSFCPNQKDPVFDKQIDKQIKDLEKSLNEKNKEKNVVDEFIKNINTLIKIANDDLQKNNDPKMKNKLQKDLTELQNLKKDKIREINIIEKEIQYFFERIQKLKKSGVSTFGAMSTPSAKKKCNIFVLLVLGFAIYWFFFMRNKGSGSFFGKRRRR